MSKIEYLKDFLHNGMTPRYFKEEMFDNSFSWNLMKSFCDIPLEIISDHFSEYGQFAIGLKHKWAIKNNINPVHYILPENEELWNNLYIVLSSHGKGLKDLEILEYDDSKKSSNIFRGLINRVLLPAYYQQQSEVFSIVLLMKRFQGHQNGSEKCFYEEREWRSTIQKELITYDSMMEFFDLLQHTTCKGCYPPFMFDNSIVKELSISEDEFRNKICDIAKRYYTIKVSENDITRIIVDNEVAKQEVLDFVKKNGICGKKLNDSKKFERRIMIASDNHSPTYIVT